MDLKRLMGTNLTAIFTLLRLVQINLRILYQDSCKVGKEILGVAPAAD
jgi:hypothetical protein